MYYLHIFVGAITYSYDGLYMGTYFFKIFLASKLPSFIFIYFMQLHKNISVTNKSYSMSIVNKHLQ